MVCTQGFKNHAVRSDKWRYIRYADGSEELYNQETDPRNFHNLANQEEYNSVKQELAAWLPKQNTDNDPLRNAQKEQNRKGKTRKNRES